MKKKLTAGIESMNGAMGNLDNLCPYTKDSDVIAAYAAWKGTMENFTDYCSEILAEAEKTNFDTIGTMVTNLKTYIDPAQAAEEAFDTLVNEKQMGIQEKTTTMIERMCMFSMALAVLFVLVLAGIIVIVVVTISRPAKKSGTLLRQIVSKIENQEGDLTERIPVRTKDEIGQMTDGINGFMEQLQGIMRKLKSESEQMMISAETVCGKIDESNESAGSVSAAMEEMSPAWRRFLPHWDRWQREATMF